MSSCNQYAELVGYLCLETGAIPRHVAPLARRLRRLATTHQRRCCVQCNGCRTCSGAGYVVPQQNSTYYLGRVAWVPMEDERRTDRRPCPTCSLDRVEAAIMATCEELDKLRREWVAGMMAASLLDGRTATECPSPMCQPKFVPYFQHDPRGATVRLRLPSQGDREPSEGLPIPTSGRV